MPPCSSSHIHTLSSSHARNCISTPFRIVRTFQLAVLSFRRVAPLCTRLVFVIVARHETALVACVLCGVPADISKPFPLFLSLSVCKTMAFNPKPFKVEIPQSELDNLKQAWQTPNGRVQAHTFVKAHQIGSTASAYLRDGVRRRQVWCQWQIRAGVPQVLDR